VLIITTILIGREVALDSINGGIIYGVLLGIFVLFLNAIPYNMVFRFYEMHRCPKCNSLGVKKYGKEIEEYTKTITEEYSYASKPGIFRKKFETIVRYTNHKLYCPHCKITVNHIEITNQFDLNEFQEAFANGEFVMEAAESVKECAENE
jgi:ribosomal protein L37AE/L43A